MVGVLDELGRSGVVAQAGIVLTDTGDRPVHHPQRLFGGVIVGNSCLAGVLVDHQPPQPLQEAVRAHHVLGCPWPGGLQRSHRHLVDPQRVRTVSVADLVRRNRVLQALTDLAEFLEDLDVAALAREHESPVAFDDLGGWYVGTPGVGVGMGLDVALVNQPPVRLAGRDVAEIVKYLVPEPRVQQVQHRVLDPANVEVHAARIVGAVFFGSRTHPVRLVLLGAELLAVVRVGVAQLVPRTAGPLRHNVGVAGVGTQTVAQVQIDVHPVSGLVQRRGRFTVGVVRVEQDRGVILDVREFNRQHRIGQRVCAAVLVVDDGKGFPPVALPGEEPVAQFVFDPAAAPAIGLESIGDRPLGGLNIQAVEVTGVHQSAVAGVGLLRNVASGDHFDDRQAELPGELPVTLIVAGHRHDGPGPVTE